jgi:hypothetical protein
MNKAAALEFIGLKESLSEEAVREKYKERFNYYQMLFTNAPNKAIEQIQQQNLEKLKQAKKILLEEIDATKNRFDEKHTGPVIKSKHEDKKAEKKPVIGWLIVHTENKKMESFDLYEGINYIGRKKKDSHENNILIENDPFVSRTHAFIKCKETTGGKLQFLLYDGDGSKPSVNGVFLNGDERRINEYCLLKENDTVQIGTTKLVFKVKKDNRSISGEVEEVMQTGFIRTIHINK